MSFTAGLGGGTARRMLVVLREDRDWRRRTSSMCSLVSRQLAGWPTEGNSRSDSRSIEFPSKEGRSRGVELRISHEQAAVATHDDSCFLAGTGREYQAGRWLQQTAMARRRLERLEGV